MHDVLKMGRKVFTVSVVVATIAWSIGLAALLMPLAASAASLQSGDLIKASLPAVYYYGANGKRYVFPNEKTYKTWYADFSAVKTITDAELAAISIGGNVTYKPGVKMVKITTDPKVYAVEKGGVLRWVNSETMAGNLYGTSWNTKIDDIPDAFFVNYTVGADIATTADYNATTAEAAAPSINVDKGLASASGGTGPLTIAAASDNPAAASIVSDSDTTPTDSSGLQRVAMLKFVLSAGSADVSVTSMKFRRSGISKDSDVSSLYLMEGDTILREVTSVNDTVGTFNLLSDPVKVTANTTKTLVLAMDLIKAASSGATMNWSLASADVVSTAASVTGSAAGNTMTVAQVADLGQMDVGSVNVAPASVDPGDLNKEMWRLGFQAVGQDMLLTYVKFTNLGSANDADLQNLRLLDGATQLNGVVAQVVNKEVIFDLSTMAGGGYEVDAGQTKQLTLNGDIIGGTNRTYKWSIQKSYDIRAKDTEYNVWAFTDDYDSTNDDAFSVITQKVGGSETTTAINYGSVTVGLASESMNSTTVDGGTGIELATFDFKATGEEVKVKTLTIKCASNDSLAYIDNVLVKFDGVQVGSTDSTLKCDNATDTTTFSLGNSVVLQVGKTHKISVIADLTDSTVAVDDTLYVGITAGTAEGKISLTNLDTSITATNGHNLTVKGATLTVVENATLSDRSSAQPTGVTNGQGVKLASFIVVGGSAEAADISQIILRDVEATYFMGTNFQNLVLKKSDGTQVGSTVASLNSTAAGTYTFTPASAIRINKGEQMVFDVFADIKSSPTYAGAAYDMIEVDQVLATGVDTGSSANYGTAGNDAATDVVLQAVYIALHGNLAIALSADAPVAQMLSLGSTGASLAKFKLTADAAEDITLSEFTVAHDLTSGHLSPTTIYTSTNRASGSLKNLKLYNGSSLLATVAAFDPTNNTATPLAVFKGFTLSIPKNTNVVLEVKGDITSYADGGVPSSTHRMQVLADTEDLGHATTITDPVLAVGAGSGFAMSLAGLDVGITSGTADVPVNGNYMDLVRAKLTLAHAADSPSGSATPASQQTVAKFVATNSANVGAYSVHIYNLNLDVSSVGSSMPSTGDVTMKIYKDSITTANQLATTDYDGKWAAGTEFHDTNIAAGSFTDLEIASGSSRTIIVTLDTSTSGFSANDTFSAGIDVSGDILWNDDNATRSYDYYTVDTLPLAGKTLVY